MESKAALAVPEASESSETNNRKTKETRNVKTGDK